MSREKKGYEVILEKIEGFIDSNMDSGIGIMVKELNDAYSLLEDIKKICKGVLGDECNTYTKEE